MKNLIGFLLLIAALLWSCKPRELPKEKEIVTVTKTITEVKRDTIVKVEADSSYYEALIQCQNGKPVLLTDNGSYKITSGKNLQPPTVVLNDSGELKISCEYLENELKIALKEKRILEEKLSEKTIVPPPIEIEKALSWWQRTWIGLGKFLSFALLIFITIKIPWKAFLRL